MSLSQEQVRTIDQLRQRLSALSTSILTLKHDLERAQPLPPPVSIQQTSQMLAHNLLQLQELLSTNRQFFTSAHSYPLPKFPAHTHENQLLLGGLMRKKLDQRAEQWLDNHLDDKPLAQPSGSGVLDKDDAKTLWDWAGPTCNEMLRQWIEDGVFEDDFTIEERETGAKEVVTGLRRKLDVDDEDEEDGDGDTNMGDTKPVEAREPGIDPSRPPMRMDSMLKFLSTGQG